MRIMSFMIRLSDKYARITALLRSNREKLKNLLLLPLLLSFIIISCEEDPALIGGNLLPDSDFDSIAAVDTFRMDMYTLYSDSAISMMPSISYLGQNIDPYFGLTEADFVAQLRLSSAWPGTGITEIDSVELRLDVVDVDGEIGEGMGLGLYEVDEYLSEDSLYMTNREVPIKGIVTAAVLPDLEEDADTVVSIPLSRTFGQHLLRDTSMLFIRNDTADFRNFFNGLYFKPITLGEDRSFMVKIDVYSPATRIVVYYKDGMNLQKQYHFTIPVVIEGIERSVVYNRFLHDYSRAEPGKEIQYINEPVIDTLSYVQSIGGVYTRLVIPGLEALRDEMPLSINKARLYLPVYLNQDDYTESMVPERLYAMYDSAGFKNVIPDYRVDKTGTYVDGVYDKIDNGYELNISSFVQRYLEGDISEPELEIYLADLSTKNLILRTDRGPEDGVRFELSYTVLK